MGPTGQTHEHRRPLHLETPCRGRVLLAGGRRLLTPRKAQKRGPGYSLSGHQDLSLGLVAPVSFSVSAWDPQLDVASKHGKGMDAPSFGEVRRVALLTTWECETSHL